MKNLTISLSQEERSFLESLAKQHEFFWGNKPNINGLIKEIASGGIKISLDKEAYELNPIQQDALVQILRDAVEAGHGEAARALAEYFSKFPLLQAHFEAISSLIKKSDLPFLDKLESYIAEKQPFQISYNNSAGEDEVFQCTYGHFQNIERHRYLVAKVLNTPEKSEHPQISCNRCFRLDRINAIKETKKQWESLGTVVAVFQLRGNWTKKYETKLGDVKQEWMIMPGEKKEAILEVHREIWSFFWFLREIEKYKSVTIISPLELKEEHIYQLKEKLKLYEEF